MDQATVIIWELRRNMSSQEVIELINSDINIIGGIPDFSLIEATLSLFAKGKELVLARV